MKKQKKDSLYESTYSIVVVYELLKCLGEPIKAPTIPSLRRERCVGYDVNIEWEDFELSLQFKVPGKKKGSRAHQYRFHKKPYYRIEVPNDRRHSQFATFDNRVKSKGRVGFYVAPLLQNKTALDVAFNSGNTLEHSIWIPLNCLQSQQENTHKHITFVDCKRIIWHSMKNERGKEMVIECGFSWRAARNLIHYFRRNRKIRCAAEM